MSDHSTTAFATPGLRALAERLVAFESQTHDQIFTVPAEHYLNPDRLSAEREAVFHRLPVPLMPSAYLKPGESVTHDHYGLPLVVTRDKQGEAHVLINVCQHRGTRLVESDERQVHSRLVCPYHAWTYRLDGRLQGLPQPDTFPGLNKAKYSLRSLPVRESGGLIWTRLNEAPFEDSVLGSLVDDFEALGMTRGEVFEKRSYTVAANWKLLMDAFSESYHVQRLHKNTIAPFFADSVAVGDRVGLHFRSAVARKHFRDIVPDQPLDAMRVNVTFSFNLMPATVIVASPDYLNVMFIHPISIEESTVIDYMIVPSLPDSPDELEHWRESFDLIDGGVFYSEDFRAAQLGQRGLSSGTIDKVTLGSAEHQVYEFHQTIQQLIDRSA
ncbi:MAG: aromatic ring-hydroxylating dioxygenase subunit alpha [Pseudomonadota bacterium]